MDKGQFLEQVKGLREAGKSVRAIALELMVHRSRVERALKALARRTGTANLTVAGAQPLDGRQSGVFVGRQR